MWITDSKDASQSHPRSHAWHPVPRLYHPPLTTRHARPSVGAYVPLATSVLLFANECHVASAHQMNLHAIRTVPITSDKNPARFDVKPLFNHI